MFFDDRLATVLRQRADSDVGKRTQFRQLLDILGAERRTGERASRDPSLLAAAWLRMDALGQSIPAAKRAEMVGEPGWRFRNPQLAAHLAEFEPDVAYAALTRAQLSSEDWTALIPRLPVRARGFLRLRRDLPVDVETLLDRLGVHDRGLPSPPHGAPDSPPHSEPRPEAPEPAQTSTEDAPPPFDLTPDLETTSDIGASDAPEPEFRPQSDPAPAPAPDPQAEGRSEISALVERIAQFKRNRESTPGSARSDDPAMPRLPLGEDQLHRARRVGGFGFAADAAGRIEWADSEVAPMVIGTRLVAAGRMAGSTSENPLARAFNRRQPINSASLELHGAEAIAGEWVIDAQPRFTEGGSFAGYVGRFRRPALSAENGLSPAEREADRIRQLLHELRTPVTAVQGYAEVIQQQLFGTAPHEYRALAAAIAGDAARILAGFEELDRLAKLETGVVDIEPGEADLAALAQATVKQLEQVLTPRMAGIEFSREGSGPVAVAVDQDELEALLWRLLATLGGGCSSGEMLEANLSVEGGVSTLTCELPAQLLSEEDIFAAEARPIGSAINAGLFGAGFALRLARAEAKAAGGALQRDDETIVLTLPLAQDSNADELRRDG